MMMDNDRELLELAAKAYWGDEIDDVCSVEWSEADQSIAYTHGNNQDHNGCDVTLLWNPLTDDGDALRLAVKFQMVLDIQSIAHMDWVENYDKSDPVSATRRAITRAAAEIGRQGRLIWNIPKSPGCSTKTSQAR